MLGTTLTVATRLGYWTARDGENGTTAPTEALECMIIPYPWHSKRKSLR